MEAPRPHRVLAVDDDPTVRRAYRDFFATRDDFELVGEAVDGSEAEPAYADTHPDVVLMDLQMPVSGVEATRDICARWPRACVVAMTTFASREYVVAALRAGASGYLVKGITGPQLLAALRQALAGEMPLSSAVRRELVTTLVGEPILDADPERTLKPREVELMNWIAHGYTNRQIASRMEISEGSVKQYVSRVCGKLDAVSRTQALVRAIQLGIVDPITLPTKS